ncbi:MAG TPA: holo-ACP synthase [Synergistales bacterium]|nr:holo-ACP synthase [Synergistales bacterium]
MIIGVGVDLCSVSRIAAAIANRRFVEKVFSPEEQLYAESGGNPALHYASSFAAKEAFAKAGGWGLARTGLASVWVSRKSGRPEIRLSDRAKRLFPDRTGRIHLSLSHEGDLVVAVVILEGINDPLL